MALESASNKPNWIECVRYGKGPKPQAGGLRTTEVRWGPQPDASDGPCWVLTGQPVRCDESLPLQQVLAFANLAAALKELPSDDDGGAPLAVTYDGPPSGVREYGLRYGPLGIGRIAAEWVSRPGRPPAAVRDGRVEGEPLSGWVEEIKHVADAILRLRLLGAFTVDEPPPQAWEWLMVTGQAEGAHDPVGLLDGTRELINAKLREHHVVLALGQGTRLPLPYALSHPTAIAATWKRIAECATRINPVRFCAVCHRPLVHQGDYRRPGRRKHARVCSATCRAEKSRRARKGATS